MRRDMPNYSLVANSTFQPFTYQELMLPVERQNQYFERLAEEYDKISSQADVLEAMGANDRDKGSSTYGRYKAYSDALRQEADNLYRFGLNTESRQRLSDLRRRYNTEIVPIQNAWNKREQEAQLQTKVRIDAAARGVDLRFSREAANTNLQDYIDNPNLSFRTINGQQLTNEVASQFAGLAKQIQEGKISKNQLSPIEYQIITQRGMDFNQYADFINNPNDPKFDNIRGIVNNTLNAHGIQDFDMQTQMDMFKQASMGVAAGVGARDMQFHTDEYAKDMLNFNQQIALQDRAQQHALDLARAKGEIGGGQGDNFPKLKATNTGIETVEGYSANGLAELNKLKGGTDALKASYFGRQGEVNPMLVYKEYQEELKKHRIPGAGIQRTTYAPVSKQDSGAYDAKKAKEEVLKKYAKYGVTEILNDKQYEVLSGMGYSEKKSPIAGGKYSNLVNGFNNLVVQKTAYDIPMAEGAYKETDSSLTAGLIQNKKHLGDKVFEYNGYKKGKGVTSLKDLGVDESDPSKSASILTIGYDPNHKGFIRVTYNNGKVFLMKPELLGWAEHLRDLETRQYTNRVTGETRNLYPEEITSGIARNINWYNPGAPSTSDKAF